MKNAIKRAYERSVTRDYFQTLKSVKEERGLKGAIMHESLSTLISFGTRADILFEHLPSLAMSYLAYVADPFGGPLEGEIEGKEEEMKNLIAETRGYITNRNLLTDFVRPEFLPKKSADSYFDFP